jgi:type II secretion system protein N
MKERLKALAPKLGFPVFYLFCLVLFARWTFPYDKLRDRIVLSFNQQQRESGGQQELKIDELGPASIAGLHATGVHLLGPPSEPGKAPSDLKIDEAKGSISIFGLLFGSHDLSFKIDAFGGVIDGVFEDSSKERKIDVTLEAVNLAQVDALPQMIGVPVEGTVDGSIKLTLPEGKASKATGSLSLETKDVAVGDGKAKLKGLLALPRLVIGGLTIAGDAKEGTLKLSKLAAGGKDLELAGDGRIQLRESLGDSLADVNVRFKINDAYRSKNDMTKNLFGAPGSTMPALFELDPTVKQSKRPDGFYGWHMRGPLSKPAFDPAPNAGAPATPGGKP